MKEKRNYVNIITITFFKLKQYIKYRSHKADVTFYASLFQ